MIATVTCSRCKAESPEPNGRCPNLCGHPPGIERIKKAGNDPRRKLLLGSSFRYAFLEPILYLRFDPPYTKWAELYPFRELPCRFESGDMSWGIQHHLTDVPLG